MKYLIVANPAAGKGEGEIAIPRIEALMHDRLLDFDLVRTERPMHAADLAEEAARAGVDVVVAAGGDGTANEVINGLMRLPRQERTTAVGTLCVGRGNDFAYGAGMPADLAEGVRVLAEGHRDTIDVGHVVGGDYPEGRYFGNGIGIGFDAVVTLVAGKQEQLHGYVGYIAATLKTAFLYFKAPLVSIEYDDARTGAHQNLRMPALMVSVMNGRRMGGGFMMAPDGNPGDGLFDLCIARQVSRLRIFQLVPHFMKGTQATQEPITMGRTGHLTVTAIDQSLPAHADGEMLCTEGQRLEMQVIAQQIDVINANGALP